MKSTKNIKKFKTILWIFLALALLSMAFAHEDEFGESESFHFLHMGKLVFPVWTYWAEIIEHSLILLTILIGLIWAYSKYSKPNEEIKLGLVEFGFITIIISETFTLLHHFLIFPFGIFNAVFHHGLLFVGILLLVCGFLKLIKEDREK